MAHRQNGIHLCNGLLHQQLHGRRWTRNTSDDVCPRPHRLSQHAYMVLSFIILLLCLIPTCLDLATGFEALYGTGSGIGYIRASLARGPGNVKDIISQFLIYTYILLADALLLWRCYIIWSDVGIQVLVLPLLLFLSVVGLSILILARITTGAIWNTTNHACIPAYTLLTVSFNVTATSLIAYRSANECVQISREDPNRICSYFDDMRLRS
ncbi:hypothetical protein CC1G_09205 [Coprinopsis cinerea okayama7|uniref:Uncharacterized protein n=1 Tax=Coprinopsis cinerea (strain Okayama-7 / 130 / ATCC MYA-4618 / FGSC 9003) TaxID=240176 RepID=A8P4W8_COPC7|nr:hypothetical protein CC1G_09205 [Coprinopsis cinerea okayama7\|eukprot:XP_001838828.2 hypothetical protein CC1G_09205 [Coprinopsis cinerea okayama7\